MPFTKRLVIFLGTIVKRDNFLNMIEKFIFLLSEFFENSLVFVHLTSWTLLIFTEMSLLVIQNYLIDI